MKSRRSAPASGRQSNQTGTPDPVTIPPNIAALALFAAPGYDTLPYDFRTAWVQMPGIVQAIALGQSDVLGTPSRDLCARAMFEADVETSRRVGDGFDARLAQIVDVLQAFDADALDTLQYHIGDPSFYTGLAMGLYLALNPAPVTMSSGEVMR